MYVYIVLSVLSRYFLSCVMIINSVFYDFIVFFKQKTAYEMRISDWSSDVCSSDLPPPHPGPGSADEYAHRSCPAFRLHTPRRPLPRESAADQIGRASCRERVCQYV